MRQVKNDFIDPKTKKPLRKTLVFMLIYGKDNLLARKIKTMVQSFGLYCIALPNQHDDMKSQKKRLQEDLENSLNVYQNTVKQIKKTVSDYMDIVEVTRARK